ncbi:hypothetical protein [Paenibacillus campi]|uniref:hypothetical protein n=1 Tax=Paenibacillus campi TaxID=3106031 RepID=UPI002AFE27E8|nr:hypothetical protein [Paenibacillus sp. SGZ-1014]
MSRFTYTGLMHRVMDMYAEHGSAAAYHFICEHLEEGQANPAQMYNLRYSLLAACGRKDEALALLKEAVLEQGYWYNADDLSADDDLAVLQAEPDMQHVLELCRLREAEALAESTGQLHIVLPETGAAPAAYRTLLVLHGELENNEAVEPIWHTALNSNYKLALLQSSQIQFSGAYDWSDLEQSNYELEQALLELGRIDGRIGVDDAAATSEQLQQVEALQHHVPASLEQASAASTKPIIAGFSSGARAGLHAAATYPAAIAGLILVAPWLPDATEWQEALTYWQQYGVKLYIVCGEHDDDCLPGTEELVAELRLKGIEHQLHLMPGLGHNYPVHFEQLLTAALAWMNES